jgi:ATP-binding cassette subfamily G (WHITE) protein 2 (PDR)
MKYVSPKYQASLDGPDRLQVFDKVTVLYEGRQIYFGPCDKAKAFFINMGFECGLRQTTADFLTSLTSPAERKVREGFENRTPRTAEEFAAAWNSSPEYAKLLEDIDSYEQTYPIGGASVDEFIAWRRVEQAPHQCVDRVSLIKKLIRANTSFIDELRHPTPFHCINKSCCALSAVSNY